MSINVVYLAYFNETLGYNFDFVSDFVNSYKKYSAGIEHSLTIIAKNCPDAQTLEKVSNLAKEVKAKVIELPDDGFDFGAYFRVAELIEDDYIMFCGSQAQIKCKNWLGMFYKAFKNDKSIKLAGPMGSWGDAKFKKFPNYHIRTTAFMVEKEMFLDYISKTNFPVTKEDTYEIEHGEKSITNFVLNQKNKVVVVNNKGEVFNHEDWDISETFRYPLFSKSIFDDKYSKKYEKNTDHVYQQMADRGVYGRSLKNARTQIFVSYDEFFMFWISEVFQPLYKGNFPFPEGHYGIRDNIGDNIAQKSDEYRKLTGQYWVWKNLLHKLKAEYIGFFDYRRFLDFNILNTNKIPFHPINLSDFLEVYKNYNEDNIYKCINGYDVVVPDKFVAPSSIKELFLNCTDEKDIDLLVETIKEVSPEFTDAAETVLSGNELYSHLIYIIKKDLFPEFMQWLFSILEVIEKQIDMAKYENMPDNHIIVNMAEVLFNIWLCNKSKNIKILESSSLHVEGDLNV